MNRSHPGPRRSLQAKSLPASRHSSTWGALPLLLAWLAFLSSTAGAQVPPTLSVSDVAVFEGNSGPTTMQIPVTLSGPSSTPVTALLSATALTGRGFNPATGGPTCTAGVDFLAVSGAQFTIPANTTTVFINLTLCGDSTIEPNEHIFVALTQVVGAQCFEGTCNGVATIKNDDGPPTISINSISTSAPIVGTKTTSFTVSLSHPTQSETKVSYTTSNGTARANTSVISCGSFGSDYDPRSNVLTIPPGEPSGKIGVPICRGAGSQTGQTFFMTLSSPINGSISVSRGTCTIFAAPALTGGFELTPASARIGVGEQVLYVVDWTVPAGEVWRDLTSIDLRVQGRRHTAAWVRWDEATNAFRLCSDDGQGPAAVCTTEGQPGATSVLDTPFAQFQLVDTRVVGSGPTGPSVTLTMAVRFKQRASGESYEVQLAAADDFGRSDDFSTAGSLYVHGGSSSAGDGVDGPYVGLLDETGADQPATGLGVGASAGLDWAVVTPELPDELGGRPARLAASFPNPFNPSTTVAYELAAPQPVQLLVYDNRGRRVRVLVDEGLQAAGRHAATWNGQDDAGRQVASGVYFLQLIAGTHVERRSVALIE